ncbi:uracil-DNA glycosylase [Poseidonibacter lekithochrous]|uniref:uracil-DNA glycosylase n=1 Tax=Poseidonibacter lekithochrous TaxID=1904463 RepID=UPI0008FC4905|nr:uracil-DNA glycosylase [Poseidonibacter lekithochrous]QKJ24591.1 uracil-DNA glycosylase, family 1 [Poseidonibacter lekithochrous]
MTWEDFFKEEEKKDYYKNLISQVNKAYETTTVFPPKDKIYNAFDLTPLENTKVVLLGQDPYHGAGQAQGLAFSTPEEIKNPPSMRNMLKEINEDIGSSHCENGDLTSWAKDGVLLINAILTVEEAKAKSHHKMGWEKFTDNLITFISNNCSDVVFILWGASAIKKQKIIDESKHHILSGVHPSPLSAYRGFFGCKHFSQTNDILKSLGKEEITW